MKVKFLGSASSLPDKNEDSPCFLVNEKYLFDCGFSVLTALKDTDCDLSELRYIFFTHMHHDHYLGFPALLFYLIHSKNVPLNELTIVGPEKDVERVVKLSYDFLQLNEFFNGIPLPKIVKLAPGETLETEDFTIKTRRSQHPVQALMYKISDGVRTLAISGDGTYLSDSTEFYFGADALIHDSTLGSFVANDDPRKRQCGHSTLYEAVMACENSSVPVLFPVHMNLQNCKDSIKKVQPTTNVKIVFPEKGKEFEI